MSHKNLRTVRSDQGLPVAPSMADAIESVAAPAPIQVMDRRILFITLIAIGIAIGAALAAQVLMHLIWLITGLCFHGVISLEPQTPLGNKLGVWIIALPAIGGVIVGIMARYGSRAIRGHGIPEAMEQVIENQSRIPPRMTFLKPISSAIAIGTGGPFGAEGPIIATGGALGSFVGQMLHTTTPERKTLLAAGAAAGMAATFGAPVSAVLLAIELLLFEFRSRSLVPVAMACVTATGIRWAFEGTDPVFAMPDLQRSGGEALALYVLIGALIGVASVITTRIVYAVEDGFERLPIHWMWWPAIGGLVVGMVGYFFPRTLGVGYYNISDIISGNLLLATVASLALWKFISWSIALGSGTSGGTLAPLFTIGGALGALLGAAANALLPGAGVDPRIAALVGMAAIFAGASRAMLASAVFAFETTLQPLGLLPILGGCAASFLVSSLLMRNTIMTEKIARRGVRVPSEYEADYFAQVLVRDVVTKNPVTLRTEQTVRDVRDWLQTYTPEASHQGYPVLDERGVLHSVVTRKQIMDPARDPDVPIASLAKRPPVIVYDDNTLRDAADHMVRHRIGRLPVIDRASRTLIGIITRSDLLDSHGRRLSESHAPQRHLSWRTLLKIKRGEGPPHPTDSARQ